MKNVFEKYIDWEELGPPVSGEYDFDVEDVTLKKSQGVLTIRLALNFVMPLMTEKKLAAIIGDAAKVNDVEFTYNYTGINQSRVHAVKAYLPRLIERVNGEYRSLTDNIFTDKVEEVDGDFFVATRGKVVSSRLNDTLANIFEEYILSDLGISGKIIFRSDAASAAEMQQALEKDLENQAIQAAIESRELAKIAKEKAEERRARGEDVTSSGNSDNSWGGTNAGPKRVRKRDFTARNKAKELPADGNIIMGGKKITDELIPIDEITTKMRTAVTGGVVFYKDIREYSGTFMVKLYISDKKNNLRLKTFVTEEKSEELNGLIEIGDYIKVSGQPKLDSYDNYALVLWVDQIEKGEVPVRDEEFEGPKRVELHCHTKMSRMDGLNDVSTIIESAVHWGQPAVAITDHGVVQSFPDAMKLASQMEKKETPIKVIYGMEGYVFDDSDCIMDDGTIDYKKKKTNHIILLVASQEGMKNLYKLVSYSHLNYFYKVPRLPKSVISAHRDGLIIGSACEAGEVFRAITSGASDEEVDRIASFYDYLEIQPLINNQFMIDKGYVKDKEALRNFNRRVLACGERLGKRVCATTDAHYDLPESAVYRRAIQASMGFENAENGQGLYLRTTKEMLDEFSYLGEETAYKVVVENTQAIADLIADGIRPIPKGKFPPIIDGSDEELRTACLKKAKEIYGDPLPEKIEERLNTELNSIISNNYSVMYISAKMLIDKSMEDGYSVGSRGSVGSSFAATMAGITEVNPLEPHYLCPECKYLEWGDTKKYSCGLDLPMKNCPNCGTPLVREGFDIPFATFLGFDGTKEPDIDLNFAGEYQSRVHKYVGEIFGEDNIFKAGEVSALKEKNALRIVKKYEEKTGTLLEELSELELAVGCVGVKSTTGQHPGGIIVLPSNHEIYEFCPVQHPANKDVDIITTHFDYHKLDENLLKLDLLGHTGPTIFRQLYDMTGVNPLKVDVTDRKVLSIFNSTEALDILDPEYAYTDGTFAIPEFGTPVTRRKLNEINPSTIADLVRISGISHGQGIWEKNAQDLIQSGKVPFADIIACRDDIMNYLISKGMENKSAFDIMERVRKGKGVTEEQEQLMLESNVPEWYIESCNKIKYMFPKAHAAAYVMTSMRMAWYKVYYPREFYAAYFSSSVDAFDSDVIMTGPKACLDAIRRIEGGGRDSDYERKEKDKKLKPVYETAYEMYSRGYEFKLPELGLSHATKFRVDDGKVLLPYVALTNVGETAAKSIYDAYEDRPFSTVEDAVYRSKVNKNVVDSLRSYGILNGLPESDQLSFF